MFGDSSISLEAYIHSSIQAKRSLDEEVALLNLVIHNTGQL